MNFLGYIFDVCLVNIGLWENVFFELVMVYNFVIEKDSKNEVVDDGVLVLVILY